MTTNLTAEESAALEILRLNGANILNTAIMAREILHLSHGNCKKAVTYCRMGAEQAKQQSKTVSFSEAVKAALEARKDRRSRTLCDFRYLAKRLMKRNPDLAKRRMRSLTEEDCRTYLQQAFETPQQFRKGRAILSCIFSTAYRRGWCAGNPARLVELPRITEKPIQPLNAQEVQRLETTAAHPEHRDMQFSLQLMLYCGVRPAEISRINPQQDIDRNSGQLIIRPHTSKTGGGRVIPLRKAARLPQEQCIIPHTWQKRWRALRRAAGFTHWQQDACRHTFATCHAQHFKNMPMLQQEMGHGNLRLLQTRYIIGSKIDAAAYWQ